MREQEPDRVERGVLLALFLGGILAAGLIVLCLGIAGKYTIV